MGLGKFATIDAGVWKVVAVVAGVCKVVAVVAGVCKVVTVVAGVCKVVAVVALAVDFWVSVGPESRGTVTSVTGRGAAGRRFTGACRWQASIAQV